MNQFVYYCDKDVKWIDIYESLENKDKNDSHIIFDEAAAIDFAKKYYIPFIGSTDNEKEKAKSLNILIGLDSDN
ncbi:MAG: hypothetical protein J1G30_09240 [Spirochaetales bacterium]|nr:hypothetical protein [Spirochaetales bacterium]